MMMTMMSSKKRRIPAAAPSSLPLETEQQQSLLSIENNKLLDAAGDVVKQKEERSTTASKCTIHASLVLGQVFFGLGSVIAALGLPACNPFAFALTREICAGIILLGADQWMKLSSRRQRKQRRLLNNNNKKAAAQQQQGLRCRLVLLGLVVYGNQAGMIAGIKLAGPIAAAVWQPSQPIMTAAISTICLKWEPLNWKRLSGVALAFGGCAVMVILSSSSAAGSRDKADDDDDNNSSKAGSMSFLIGNVLFFVNCLCTSLYVLLSKKVLTLYSPLSVSAWSYNIAAVFMAMTALLASTSERVMSFFCPDCTSWWSIPSGALFALGYFILFNSVAAYAILTWANQYATGTLVMGYTVLQPVTAALLTILLLKSGATWSCTAAAAAAKSELSNSSNSKNDAALVSACLDPPGWGSIIGMIGVFAGLYLVIVTEPADNDNRTTVVLKDDYDPVVSKDDDDDSAHLTTSAGEDNVAEASSND